VKSEFAASVVEIDVVPAGAWTKIPGVVLVPIAAGAKLVEDIFRIV
jgi:hypothetical protein